VVAKAKERGLETSETNVHRVRKLQKHPRPAGKAAKKAAPAHKPAAATKGRPAVHHAAAKPAASGTSAADFVRSLGGSVAVKDVVAKAKAAGIKVSRNYVYKVRSKTHGGPARRRGRPPSAARHVAPAATHTSHSSHVSHASAEGLLKAVAAELGLGRSLELLQAERARVRAVIGG